MTSPIMPSKKRRSNLFTIAGALLLVYSVIWIYFAVSEPVYVKQLDSISTSTPFKGKILIPLDEVNRIFTLAENRLSGYLNNSRTFRIASEVCDWISFLLTSIITVLAGYVGIVLRPGEINQASMDTLAKDKTKGFVRLIGLLAAGSAVLTAGGSRALTKAEDNFKHAEALQKKITDARINLVDAKNEVTARNVLSDLKFIAER